MYREGMRGEEAVQVVDGERCGHWPEPVELVYLRASLERDRERMREKKKRVLGIE